MKKKLYLFKISETCVGGPAIVTRAAVLALSVVGARKIIEDRLTDDNMAPLGDYRIELDNDADELDREVVFGIPE